jgi:hypothetical protein
VEQHFEEVEAVTWQDQLRFTDPEPFMRFYEVGHNHCCQRSTPSRRCLGTVESGDKVVPRAYERKVACGCLGR